MHTHPTTCSRCGAELESAEAPCPICFPEYAANAGDPGAEPAAAPADDLVACRKCGVVAKITPETGLCDDCKLRSLVFTGRKDEAPTEFSTEATETFLEQGVFVGGQQFRLIRKLGGGGMGVVWLAEDLRLSTANRSVWVALKFLAPHVQSNASALAMMREEVLQCRALRHHNIISIYQWHEEEHHLPFISMEYVDGLTLSDLRRQQPSKVMSWELLKPLTEEVCEALDYAHTVAGVVHRDLKPSNIMVDAKGRVRLADFGMACAAASSVTEGGNTYIRGGTLAFMSPQQYHGCQPTAADDIYSLGATLYCLLTSTPPFYEGDIAAQLIGASPQPIPDRLAQLNLHNPVPAKLLAIIARCLDKTPGNRPTAREILKTLPLAPHIAPVDPGRAAPDTGAEDVPESKSVGWGTLVLLAVILAGVWFWVHTHSSRNHAAGDNSDAAKTEHTNDDSPQGPSVPQPRPTSTTATLQLSATMEPRDGVFLSNRILSVTTGAIVQDWQLLGTNKVTLSSQTIQVIAPTKPLRAGRYEVQMLYTKRDEQPVLQTRNIVLEGGNDLNVPFSFRYRLIRIQTDPPGARVVYSNFTERVDNTTPTTERQWIPGNRTLLLELPNYRPIATNLTIEPSDTPETIFIEFKRSPAHEGVWNRSSLKDPRLRFVYLDSIWACRYEVTRDQFASFVKQTGYTVPKGMIGVTANGFQQFPNCSWQKPPFAPTPDTGDQPVVGVSWDDAKEFCRWLTVLDQDAGVLESYQSYDLPTSAEFTRMARGFEAAAGKGNYAGTEVRPGPWHWAWETFVDGRNVPHQDAYPRTAPVGSNPQWQTPETPEGLFDLGGNVAEWCSDWYSTNLNLTTTLQKIPFLADDGGGKRYRVVRGASWFEEQMDDIDISTVSRCDPKERNDRVGFRLIIRETK